MLLKQVRVKIPSSLLCSGRKLYSKIGGSAETGARGCVDYIHVAKFAVGSYKKQYLNRKEK